MAGAYAKDATIETPPAARSRLPARRSARWYANLGTLAAALVVLGIGLRLAYYLMNPALSSDEAAISLNLMHRSYGGLFHQLDVNQAAPPGFLVLEKLAIDLFGPTPSALRAPPLIAGIAAMILFYAVAKRVVGDRAAVVGTAMFATTAGLVTYSGTIKPYEGDAAVALALYALYLRATETVSDRHLVMLGIAGAVAVWLSYPAAFVLAGIGTALLLAAARISRRAVAVVGVAIGAWLISWGVAYSLTLSSVSHLQHSLGGAQPGVGDAADHVGLLQTYAGVVRFLIGVPDISHGARSVLTVCGFALAVLGFVMVARARWLTAVALVIPGALAVIASAADKYALFPRTFLFLAPQLIMLTAGGIAALVSRRIRVVALAGVGAGAIALAWSAYAAGDLFDSTTHPDAVRALRYLTANARPGDALYLHTSSQLDFRYYVECGCFGSQRLEAKARSLWPVHGPLGKDSYLQSVPPRLYAGSGPNAYARDLTRVGRRPRVWLFVMAPRDEAQSDLRRYADDEGRRLAAYPASLGGASAAVTLYDFR